MRLFLLTVLVTYVYASPQFVKSQYSSGVKSGYTGPRYQGGENLIRHFNNTQPGYGGYVRPNLTQPLDFEKGVCYREVPTASIAKDPTHVPAGNGSRPDLSSVRTCCKGYTRNIHNFKLCDPVCTQECINALCTEPEVCTCYPQHVKNSAGICVATCPIGCQNGVCSGGECICKNGYKLDSESKYCIPVCRDNCGGLGNCTAPNTCECKKGYISSPDGTCKPHCDQCAAFSQCVAPNECRCEPGYVKNQAGACISQCDNNCQPNGRCVGPNKCVYPVTSTTTYKPIGYYPQGAQNHSLNPYPNYPGQYYPGNQQSLYPGNHESVYPGNQQSHYPGNQQSVYPGNQQSTYPGNQQSYYPYQQPNQFGNQQSHYPEQQPYQPNRPGQYNQSYPYNQQSNYPTNYSANFPDLQSNNPDIQTVYIHHRVPSNYNNQHSNYSLNQQQNTNLPINSGNHPTNQHRPSYQPSYPGNQHYYPQYPSQQNQSYPYDQQSLSPDSQVENIGSLCSKPCINGICVGRDSCSCNHGYVIDDSDPTVSRCKPYCPGGCPNGMCSSPSFCICDMGYYKDSGVKGQARCVKRVRRSAETPINVAELLVFEIPEDEIEL